jgi:hypothetical protein
MAQDYEEAPPGFRWATDTSSGITAKWLEPIPQDRSIPNVTPEGELIPTPPTKLGGLLRNGFNRGIYWAAIRGLV